MDQIRSASRTNRSLRLAKNVSSILFACAIAVMSTHPTPVRAQFGISLSFGPPAIPYYQQPPCPEQNDVWMPGYWAYGQGYGYYWVPGTWVQAPDEGLYWTPGYWGWNDSSYRWNQGYWAPQVGYYGGIDYGYGYGGHGYDGGRWQGNRYSYNTAITNVNRSNISSVYVARASAGSRWDRRSYNGGNGGVTARPTRSELAVAHGRRVPATSVQVQHQRIAATNRLAYASSNRGRPALAAVARPYSSRNRPAVARPLAARTAPVHVAAKHVAPAHVAAVRPHAATVHPVTHAAHAAPVAHYAPAHAPAPHYAAVHAATPRYAPVHAAAPHYAPVHAAAPHYAPVHAAAPHYAPVHATAPMHAPAPHAAPMHAGAPPAAHGAPAPEHHEPH